MLRASAKASSKALYDLEGVGAELTCLEVSGKRSVSMVSLMLYDLSMITCGD